MLSRRRMIAALPVLAFGALTFGVGPGNVGASRAQNATFPTAKLDIVTQAGTRHSFVVEVANSREQLSQGLMFRKTMAAGTGMLFDFGRIQPASMWMKNTLIPLDMLFVGGNGKIAGIAERTVPGSLEIIDSPGPIRAVIELNGGTASRLDLKPGDRVVHPLFPSP